MADGCEQLPEPLQRFDRFAEPLAGLFGQVDGLRAEYQLRRDSGRVLANVEEALRIELTYNSNAIEGNTLSLRQTQLVIEGHAPGGAQSMRELYEARNHDLALRAIEEWARSRPKAAPISEADLLAVHGRVLADIDTAAAGRFRQDRVLIAGTGFVPPGSQKFGVLIPALLELANRAGIHPVIGAAELHYNLAAVHPFSDGNGRTARLMMNYYLLGRGYPYAIIEVKRRVEYLAALDEANAGRSEGFVRFVGESVMGSMGRLM